VWSFTTAAAPIPPPAVPGGPTPANASTDIAASSALTWTASDGASTYDVAFGTGNPPTAVATDQTAASYTPAATLAYSTTYYWQITAKGPGGSTAGPVWSFTTAAAPIPPPAVPGGPTPANASTDIAPSSALTWTASAGANTYDVAIGTSNPPTAVATDETAASYTPAAALAYSTTYYWQITAKGPGGSTAGPVWSFTTAAAPPPTETLDRLRLLTWNISMGKNLAGTMNVDAQVALMADSGAHVIALQEVTVSSATDLRAQYEARLEALTQRDWTAVWAPDPRATPSEGNLILTMLPVLSSSIFQYDSTPSDPSWLDTKRAAAQITVSVNGVPVTVFATHLPLDANNRRLHVNAMLNWMATFDGPRIFGGDLNTVAGTTEYNAIRGAFADTWTLLAPGDQGFTMDKRSSAGNAPGRIDYWWQENADTQARGTEAWVIKTKRSDHHALVIDLDVHPK
jgi:endonuclease/exonuclease/phosphatase family metal-dependent hydrolase